MQLHLLLPAIELGLKAAQVGGHAGQGGLYRPILLGLKGCLLYTSREPSIFTMGIRSFIRFRVRRKVDLPQPEGPMREMCIRDRHTIH